MPNVISLGELLVEIMRRDRDVPHDVPGVYLGPFPSGAPAIFIDTVARLGESAGFIGVVGDDDFGKMLLRRLREDGVDVSRIKVLPGYTTGTAFVMYYSTGERKFIFHLRHAAAGQLKEEDIDPDYISEARVIHISGSALSINENCRKACYKAVDIAYRKGVIVSFDPNLRPELLDVVTIRNICKPILQKCNIIMPSINEIEAFVGKLKAREAAEEFVRKGVDIAVIKMGSRGALALTQEGKLVEVKAFKVKEVDPTGAGDVFDGAFIVAYLKGWDLEKVLEFANAAGAIKVTRFGPMEGPLNMKEVMEFIRKEGGRV
ncbi:MAG: sugar kinase [Thermoprotei archaeon]|nr:MAG: sugar kinase [Thermoprotei archaeon]